MNRWARRLGVLLSLMIVSACVKGPTLDVQKDWQDSSQLLAIDSWEFHGRMLIRSDEVVNANIIWRHGSQRDELSLFGLLGLGKKKIVVDSSGISLDEGGGKQVRSQNVDEFIAQKLGFLVPIAALRQWVLGRPLSEMVLTKIDGGFEQLGWRVMPSRYKLTSLGMLPHKLKVSKNNIKLILIIDRWEKNNGSGYQ